MTTRQKFRKLIKEEQCIMVPGAYDSMSARIIQSLGFDAIDITGFGVEASRLGQPDLGLASMSEVVDQAWSIARSVDIPVIADADTCYGGLVNVARTVRAFETVGIAGIHMEDQVTPKKCGAMAGKSIISTQEMVAKIKVARDTLDDKDFIVIGRCDGKHLGKDEVKRRLNAYLEAGSDLIMLGDDYEVEDLRDFGQEFFGKLYLVTGVFSTVPMCMPVSEYAAMGYKAVAYPVVGFLAAAKAIHDVYDSIKNNKGLSPEEHQKRCMPNPRVNELLELDKWLALERFMD